MSLFDYRESIRIRDEVGASFSACLMAALRQADTINAAIIRAEFPDIAREMQARYDAPGGLLPGETAPEELRVPDPDLEEDGA